MVNDENLEEKVKTEESVEEIGIKVRNKPVCFPERTMEDFMMWGGYLGLFAIGGIGTFLGIEVIGDHLLTKPISPGESVIIRDYATLGSYMLNNARNVIGIIIATPSFLIAYFASFGAFVAGPVICAADIIKGGYTNLKNKVIDDNK